MFDSVLIANRGEVAVRVIRACRELGIRSICVHSDADAESLPVRLADTAVRIGPPPAHKSYLDIEAVIAAGRAEKAQAVHPGYGLLSENADFARAVRKAGFDFVGPEPEIIATMGDKVAARAVARSRGVPVLPGTDLLTDLERVEAAADDIGYPLLVKAAFGGGGRGMRAVFGPEELAEAMVRATSEANAAFGRPEVYLERYLQHPRHVEVQILADAHGIVLHLGDRDCTVQRRHQKLLEEAPAPSLPGRLRQQLATAAVELARGAGYVGAGTVEFLVSPADDEFFFLEMNTRLQVEHGVTELVSGVDIVAEQLRIAAGEPLGFDQADVRISGHAVQARLSAEDPWHGFRPSPGTVHRLDVPGGPGLRADLGIAAGDTIPADYDSMFGKLQAWGANRDLARRRLAGALDELTITGINHTGPYLRSVLNELAFIEVRHDTGSVERDWRPDPQASPRQPSDQGGTAHVDGADLAASGGQVTTRRVTLHTDQGRLSVSVYGTRPRTGPPQQGQEPADVPGARDVPSAIGEPVSPMDATVVKVVASEGARVAERDVLVVLEAMKMEMEITAPGPGVVREVMVSPGDAVSAGALLVSLDDSDGEGGDGNADSATVRRHDEPGEQLDPGDHTR